MDVVGAIADPVRREILTMLKHGARTAGSIAAEFDISRPAVSRHLRVLRQHGLVRDEVRGRERVYRLDLAPLAPVEAWLMQLQTGWDPRLDALETEVYRTRREHRAMRATRASGPATPAAESSKDPRDTKDTKERTA